MKIVKEGSVKRRFLAASKNNISRRSRKRMLWRGRPHKESRKN